MTADIKCDTVGITGGTFTLTDDRSLTGDFELSGGTIDTAAHQFAINGDILFSSGNVTELLLDHSGTHNAAWNTTSRQITAYRVMAGATITPTASVYVKKLVIEATGTIAGGGAAVLVRYPGVNDCINILGTMSAGLELLIEASRTNSGRIVTGGDFVCNTIGAATFEASGEFSAGATLEVA